MNSICDMNAIVEYLENIPKFTKKHPLEHTKEFVKHIGFNEKEYKIIHVAGTNGKGSVCTMLSKTLYDNNKKVGLFISPHLVKYNERIKINNQDVSDETFIFAFNYVKNIVEELKEEYSHPTYFEFIFLIGLKVFIDSKVEYIVLETGLGGRLDATNVFENPILSIITSIGYDHMEYLGNDISDIAYEKAGIIKENVPVVFWGEDEIVKNVIEKIAKEKNSNSKSVEKKDYKITTKTNKTVDFCVGNGYYLHCTFQVPFISEYQVMNTMLLINGIGCLNDKGILNIEYDALYKSIANVSFEGRMEQVCDNVILDGAHNAPGITEFVKTFNEFECKGRKKLVFSVVKDKEYDDMVRMLADTEVSKVYLAALHSSRALPVETIRSDFEKFSDNIEVEVFSDVCQAYDKAISEKTSDDVVFCVGSLYLIGEIKKHILDLSFS